MTRIYRTPDSFKTALDQRIRARAASLATTIQRERASLVFCRLLARVDQEFGEQATLKGGLALELRVARARSTNDIDLRMMGPTAGIMERLQAAGRLDLRDYMEFRIDADPDHPTMTGHRYLGQRFRAACHIAGKSFGDPFGVDIAFGDPIVGEIEFVPASDLLEFIGVPRSHVRVYPVETHIAEKLHAYTLPRPDGRLNSRVKDLPDLALLATMRPLDSDRLRAALSRTFEHRATHALPRALPDPPSAWAEPYRRIARHNQLPWPTLAAATAATQRFLDPVLAADDPRSWSPHDWRWSARPRS